MKSLLTAISLGLALVSPAFAGIEWSFRNDSTGVGASGGSGTAAITPGAFNTGYHGGTSIPWTLGSAPGAQGFWDLGRSGSIMLSGMSANGPVTLNVFQWVEPGGSATAPYNGSLTYALGNGTPTSLGLVGTLAGAGWYAYEASFDLTPGESITVTAGAGGAIIDRITVVPEPTTLIAGVVLLIPLVLSALPKLRRKRISEPRLGL